MRGVPFERHESVRIAFAGVGGRGTSLLRDVLAVEGVQITALHDISAEALARAGALVETEGQSPPAVYRGDESVFASLCARDDIDLIYVASPWDQHVRLAVMAMESGSHVAVEVPAATTLGGCWELVNTSERTRRHCVLLENCCYGDNELLLLNMTRDGCFGEITHGEAAYIHDLRAILLADKGEGMWRREPHRTRNGNLYPTHGLGPVARCMNIHQGDRFTRLVSMSSREAGLTAYRDRVTGDDDPKRKERYVCGDINTSLIQTAQGKTIVLQHDIVTPRPYDRGLLIGGTKGAFRDYPPRIYLEDDSTDTHGWSSLDRYKSRYEDPLWTRIGDLARKRGGHGGMDFLMNYRLIECLREGLPPDIDVYDAAAWSAPGPPVRAVGRGGEIGLWTFPTLPVEIGRYCTPMFEHKRNILHEAENLFGNNFPKPLHAQEGRGTIFFVALHC